MGERSFSVSGSGYVWQMPSRLPPGHPPVHLKGLILHRCAAIRLLCVHTARQLCTVLAERGTFKTHRALQEALAHCAVDVSITTVRVRKHRQVGHRVLFKPRDKTLEEALG